MGGEAGNAGAKSFKLEKKGSYFYSPMTRSLQKSYQPSTDSSRMFVGFKMSSINSAAEMFSIPFSGPKNVGTLEVNFANVGRICVLQKKWRKWERNKQRE